MTMTEDQTLAEVAQQQLASGNARYIEQQCRKCKAQRMVHDYEASEDWCPICGWSEAWREQ